MKRNRLYKMLSLGMCFILMMGSVVDTSSLCRCEECKVHRVSSTDTSCHVESAEHHSCCAGGEQPIEKKGCCGECSNQEKGVCFCTVLKTQPVRETAVIEPPAIHWIKVLHHFHNAIITKPTHLFEETSRNAFVRFCIQTVHIIVQPVVHLRL